MADLGWQRLPHGGGRVIDGWFPSAAFQGQGNLLDIRCGPLRAKAYVGGAMR